MAQVTVRIDANRFAEIAARLRPDLQALKRTAAEQVEAQAKAGAPVLSGDLRESIHIEEDGNDFQVVADTFYARFVEFGTRHAPPQPFMKPARDAVYPAFEAAVGRLLK